MHAVLLSLVGALLLCGARSSSVVLAAAPTPIEEQYYFTKPAGLSFDEHSVPTVTLIYDAITIITTLTAATGCQLAQHTSPTLAPDSRSRDNVPVTTFATSGGTVGEGPVGGSAGSQLPSVTPVISRSTQGNLQPAASSLVTLNPSSVSGDVMSAISEVAPASGAIVSSVGPVTSATTILPADNAVSNSRSLAAGSTAIQSAGNADGLPPLIASSGSGSINAPTSAQVDPAVSRFSGIDTNSGMNFGAATTNQAVATASTFLAASPLASSGGTGSLNTTLKLSPAAIETVQLVLFLKNFGNVLFNASSSNIRSSSSSSGTVSFADSIANISLQDRTQQNTLLKTLVRAGGVPVPPCEYNLPNATASMNFLMTMVKSVEAGMFISLAESLPAEDAGVAKILSSMAGVSASQNAVLRPFTGLNLTTASFETPLSATWAYNFVLHYVRSGSCVVELPVPILPMLAANDDVAVRLRTNSNVTFAWDAAGRAAASRSGKPLHIGWVNQIDTPWYTPLRNVGNGRGIATVPSELVGTTVAVLTAQPGLASIEELTRATLSGPVIVSIVR